MKEKYEAPEFNYFIINKVDVITSSSVGAPDDNDVPFGE